MNSSKTYIYSKKPSTTAATNISSFLNHKSQKLGTALQQVESVTVPPRGSLRQQQMEEISASKFEISAAERKNDRYLMIALSSLAVAVVGGVFYAPLVYAVIPAIILMAEGTIQGYRGYIKSRRFGVALVDGIFLIGTIATGHYLAAALHQTLYFSYRKVLFKTEDHSKNRLNNIFGTQPRSVWIVADGVEIEIPFSTLKLDDTIVVHAGETIPVDGAICHGMGIVDQRAFTGESTPVEKSIDDPVFASTTMLSGEIWIQVEKSGSDTLAAQIGDILTKTTDFKHSVLAEGEQLVDKGAWLTLSLCALAYPLVGPIGSIALTNTGFFYPMRFAAPISVLNFLGIASREGILIKDGRSLELLRKVDIVVFDKTGTLTEDRLQVGQIHTCSDGSELDLLTYAAAAEYKQTHPIALAILDEAKKWSLVLPTIKNAHYEVGYGLKVNVSGQWASVGSERFMVQESVVIPDTIANVQQDCYEQGYSLIYVAVDGELKGVIELHPTIRPEAKQIIEELHQRNLPVYIISGDHETPTRKLAEQLEIDHYFAEVLPEDKANLITQLQAEGHSVCFVGDGINDSIALKKANVSISLQGASTAATDTASIILMDASLNQLTFLFDLAYELHQNVRNGSIASLIPSLFCVAGIYFFHWGIVSSILLYHTGSLISVLNSMLPMLNPSRRSLS